MKKVLSVIIWYPLKDHIYLNKPAAESCRLMFKPSILKARTTSTTDCSSYVCSLVSREIWFFSWIQGREREVFIAQKSIDYRIYVFLVISLDMMVPRQVCNSEYNFALNLSPVQLFQNMDVLSAPLEINFDANSESIWNTVSEKLSELYKVTMF